MTESAIVVAQPVKAYAGATSAAVSDLSFQGPRDEVYGLLGGWRCWASTG